jgi:hypothetical protein
MKNSETNIIEPGEYAADLIYDGDTMTQVAGDFILPDYLPDIERILRVTAKSENESEKVSDDLLSFNGEVLFNVMYLSEDNKLKSVAFATDYNGEMDVPGLTEGDVVLSSTTVEDVCAQLTNPRKLLLRCKVYYEARVYRSHKIEPDISGTRGIEDEMTLERDKTEVPAMEVRRENSGELHGSYDMELDASQPAVGQIIMCELDIVTTGCSAESGMMNYQGEGVLRCLYETPDSTYALATQRFPVSAELALGLRGNCGCQAKAKTGELSASVESNSYGEPRVIEVDYTYQLDIPVFYASTVKLTRDIYSTDYDCKPVFGSCVLRSPARNYETNFTVNAVKPRSEVTTDVKGSLIMPVMTEANAKITDLKLDSTKNKLYAEGTADVFMLAMCRPSPKTTAVVEQGADTDSGIGEQEQTYCAVTYSIPIKCELDARGLSPDFGWQCVVGVTGVKGRLDSVNAYADFEVNLNVETENVGSYNYVTSASLDTSKRNAKPASAMLLYYPSDDEKLWDIAKHYSTTRRDLIAANALPAGTSEGKLPRVLTVPKTEKRRAVFEKII